MKNRKMILMVFLAVFFAGVLAPAMAQPVDRFLTETACVAAVSEGRFAYYAPSFFDHARRAPARPIAVTRPLEERACVNMFIVGGRFAWVPQPGTPQAAEAGMVAPQFDFDGAGQPIRRSDCGNEVRAIVYVPRPDPPAPAPEPKPEPPPAPKPEPPPPPVVVRLEPPPRVVLPKPELPPPAPKPAPALRKGGGHGKLLGGVAVVGVAALVAILSTRDHDAPAPVGIKPGLPVISPASRPGGAGFAIRF